MTIFLHLLGVGIAGGLGTIARYGISLGSSALFGPQYPWGTFLANMLGCLLFGLISGFASSSLVSPAWKILLLTGFLGGFTTFSAFAFENQQFLLHGQWSQFALHFIGQNVLGVLLVLLGLHLATCIPR
jgi:CrcB protein